MYSPTTHFRLASLAATLPAGSPARRSLTAHLKLADMQSDIWARAYMLAGAFDAPVRPRQELALLQDLAGRLPPAAKAAWADTRKDYKFYERVRDGVRMLVSLRDKGSVVIDGKRVQLTNRNDEEVINNLFAGLTLSGRLTDNIFYQHGRSNKNAILNGTYLPDNAAKNIDDNAKRRGLDFFSKKDVLKDSVGFDGSGGDDEDGARPLSEILTRSRPVELATLIFDTASGRKLLQHLDRLINFSGADAQRIVWEAIKEDITLLDSNKRLADAYEARTGNRVSAPGVGQVKDKVLNRLKQTLQDNPSLVAEKDMLVELSSLRRASAKKKRLASLLRKADVIKHAYDGRMLDSALDMLKDVDTALEDLAGVLDARANGEGAISDTFSAAAELSKWLRGDTSKQFDTYAKKFREQARGKTAALTPQQKSVLDAMGQGATLDYEGRSKHSRGGYALTLANGTFDRSVNERVVLALEEAGLIERTSNPQGRTVFKLAR